MFVGEKIRELRLENALLQKDLAKKIHIAPNTLSQFESGRANPSYEVLAALADFFEVSTDYLLGRADDFGNITIRTEKTSAELSPDGKELLEIFNSLEREHRVQILEYARYFAQRAHPQTYKRNKNA